MSTFDYSEAVAQRYDAAVPISDEEIGFYLDYARDAQSRDEATLELACGTGRIAIPIAREGITMVGLDSSPSMLERAREKSAGIDNLRWVEGDMRSFDLGDRFGLVTIPAGSFHLLLETEDQINCLRSAREHLSDSGWLVLDLINPNITGLSETLTSKANVLTRRPDREYRDPASGLLARTWESHEYRTSLQRLIITTVVDETGEDDRVVTRRYGTMTLRLLFRYELEHLLARSDLAIDALYGAFDRATYRGTSARMLIVARRAE